MVGGSWRETACKREEALREQDGGFHPMLQSPLVAASHPYKKTPMEIHERFRHSSND